MKPFHTVAALLSALLVLPVLLHALPPTPSPPSRDAWAEWLDTAFDDVAPTTTGNMRDAYSAAIQNCSEILSTMQAAGAPEDLIAHVQSQRSLLESFLANLGTGSSETTPAPEPSVPASYDIDTEEDDSELPPGTPSLEEALAGFATFNGDPGAATTADAPSAPPLSWGQIHADAVAHRPVAVRPSFGAAPPASPSGSPAAASPSGPDDGAAPDDILPETADTPPFADLQWIYGGFQPATNCVRTAVTLSGLSFSRDGLRFSYLQDLSDWGLEYGVADALACLFVLDNDGRWVGGKFDWISSSRTTRDFKNVYSGYAGWSLHNVPNPCTAAFVIVSRDGRKRSNVLSAIWQR